MIQLLAAAAVLAFVALAIPVAPHTRAGRHRRFPVWLYGAEALLISAALFLIAVVLAATALTATS